MGKKSKLYCVSGALIAALVLSTPAWAETELTTSSSEAGARIVVDDPYWTEALGADRLERAEHDKLHRSDIRVTFDGLTAQPLLNVGLKSGQTSVVTGEPAIFQTYWNYDRWIERAELRIHDLGDVFATGPVAIVPVDMTSGQAEWIVPEFTGSGDFTYALRVYDAQGRFDETVNKQVTLVNELEDTVLHDHHIAPIFGEDATASRNIQVKGGVVTVSGNQLDIAEKSDVTVMGQSVKTDLHGDFAVQKLLPPGEHSVEVQYTRKDGTRVTANKTASIPESEMFFIALGDLTVGTRSSESRALLEASGDDFDDTYVTGRGAFYLKGKIKGRYLLTASMDTTEDDIDQLFSNLSDKDPESILRRVDPDRYYPVYGDQSTYVDDAPTQGRFYVRLEDGDDHIVWGNFFTNVTDTEFAQIDRGLYGAKAEYNSDAVTDAGEREFSATVFAADPGTVPGREEFRATGGSVYFLEHQDLTIGSERIRVEIRDQESGLVLETQELRPFVDYEVDYIQGRIMLSSPLSSTASGDEVVRAGTLSGDRVYVVARYEYTPAFEDLDGYSTGGRVEGWVSNEVRLGMTAQSEETGDADQTLVAADILLRRSDGTYFKAEVAETEGFAFSERASLDGGFTFDQLTAGVTNGSKAQAWRVEGAVNLSDFSDTTNKSRASVYYEKLEDGFSAPGRLTNGETDRFGAIAALDVNSRTGVTLKYDSVSVGDLLNEDTMAGDARFELTDGLQLGLGIRHSDRSGLQTLSEGDLTVLGAELRKQASETRSYYVFGQGTIAVDDTRERLDRVGVGLTAQIHDQLQVNAEVSGGSGGAGALVGATWQRTDGEEYYLNYTLDADRTEPGIDGTSFLANTENTLTTGGRKRFSNALSVYGEERATFGDQSGLTHAYGLDYVWDERWSFGASFEIGDIEQGLQLIEREAYTATAGYTSEGVTAGAAFEWRDDTQGLDQRETWLFRSNLGVKASPSWTVLAKYNKAESTFSGGSFFDGDFTEAQIGGAYRPVENDRLNGLIRYTYFEDLPTVPQISNSGQSALPAQKSNIFSVDANYRTTDWLTLGGKFGYRKGEVSLSRTDEDFVESEASLFVARADIHVVKKWDALLEARMLSVDAAQDERMGLLAGVFRHIGDNARIGVGYNFTDFSDDLTDLSYNDDGFFLNIVGKF